MPVTMQRATGRIYHPLVDGCAPEWASGWGQDQFGVYAEFSLSDGSEGWVTQRMRWIPPGRFLMGSPEDEPGRAANEGPQHEVTIPEAFWIFDTPCTQALWELVMEQNPARFVDPERPVEQVSWDDCQDFITRLNASLPGLALRLPSEAEWEYACRASRTGKSKATYAGPIEILGLNNAPTVDDIAWYGGNSGEGFDLDDGRNSTAWPEKQYDHKKAGTRKVAQKRPNRWGLYDMLGNVWEWCQDWYGEYAEGAQVDPQGPLDGPGRVLRGGGWGILARSVRSAFRSRYVPGDREDYFGFRCAQAQELTSSEHEIPYTPSQATDVPTRVDASKVFVQMLDLSAEAKAAVMRAKEGYLLDQAKAERIAESLQNAIDEVRRPSAEVRNVVDKPRRIDEARRSLRALKRLFADEETPVGDEGRILRLAREGYSNERIAQKTGSTIDYVSEIRRLHGIP
jgi:formylglycine-generating enzyme required for sulfatase activity